nr:MAG TPA: Large polyvalent protein-associated domain 18 [Caudoviricetes sp.]
MFAVGHISTLGTNRLGIITKTNSSIDRKLPNFGLVFDVYGSDISNIAIGGNGDVVMNGLVQGFDYDVKSYTANNTTYEINFDSEVVILRTAGTTGSFVNLPSKRNVTSRLGITEGSAFCAEITFVADIGITETRVYGRHGKATDFGSTEFP